LYCHNPEHGVSPLVGYLHRHVHGAVAECNVVKVSIDEGKGVKSRPWNRDVCSAINIFHRAFHECHGVVPLAFTREA
jgi:hypothetical protein